MTTPQSKEPANALRILVFGANGYLGGEVLHKLLARAHEAKDDPSAPEYRISLYVRQVNSRLFHSLPISLVEGSYAEVGLIESTAAANDVVINAGSSDSLPVTQAINRGLAQRKAAGGKGVLVHVSGTQLIEGPPVGKLDDTPIYNDADLKQIEGIDETAFHRLIDLEIKRADLAGEIVGSIICPGIIYGPSHSPGKQISAIFPSLVRLALDNNIATYGAKGTNRWAQVHVSDVADLILLAMDHNLRTINPAGFERFYFAENGECEYKTQVEEIGRLLHKNNALPSADTQWVPCAQANSPIWPAKTNARAKGDRPRKELGWKPKYKLEDKFEEDVLFSLQVIQKQRQTSDPHTRCALPGQ